jgi:hypothetical protein
MTTDPYALPSVAAPVRARRERVPYPVPSSRLAPAALVAGVLAAAGIADRPFGLGYVLAIGAIAAAILSAVPRALGARDLPLAGVIAGLLAMFVLRDAPWLVFLDLLAVATLGTVLLAGARTWSAFVAAGVTVWARLGPGLPYVLRPLARSSRALAEPARRPVLRGLGLGAVLLLVFGGLFASADAAFATLVGRLVPDLEIDDVLVARLFVGALAVALVGAGVLTRLRPLAPPALPAPARRSRVEWAVPLAALVALFAVFVAVQLAVLFGGHDHVLETSGLTYAQYARQGFFQLLAVVFLTLALIGLVVSRVALDDAKDRLYARATLGALCALNFVILASAWRRLALYESVYGLSRLRLLVHATIIGLGVVLALVVVAGALWRGDWLPRACALVAGLTLLGLNVANPDALIARRAASTARVDHYYLSNLSADAAPALAPLGICVEIERHRGLNWNLSRATASGVSCRG